MRGGNNLDSWKDIKIEGISKIEKCVAEFEIWEIGRTPYGKFKVKIFERANGKYTGFTNIQVKNQIDNSPEGGVGYGATISLALEDTLRYFMGMLNERKTITVDDFEWVDPDDF